MNSPGDPKSIVCSSVPIESDLLRIGVDMLEKCSTDPLLSREEDLLSTSSHMRSSSSKLWEGGATVSANLAICAFILAIAAC